ncbi:MAG: type IX secretion system membrane protein PorP/SprF [Bacteroidia bacterium]|nr:type IX secretion system membrane protein PorP/SprF [Bacteroidia bacterium]
MKHLVLFIMLGPALAFSQQDAQFTQFHRDRLAFNPGHSGMSGMRCFGMHSRSQWLGFPGAPKTYTAWLNAYIPALNSGIALRLTRDLLGFERNNRLQLMFARHFTIGRGRLGAGAGLNLIQKTLSGDWIATDGTGGDLSIPAPRISDWLTGADAGIWYHGARVYAGLSTTQVTGGTFTEGHVRYTATRHYFASTGARFFIPANRDLEVRMHFLGKSDGVSTSTDLTLEIWWRSQFYAGGGCRPGDALLITAGARIGAFSIGYSYDVTGSALRNHSSNTHELSIRYCHPITIRCKCRSTDNPRKMWGDRTSRHGRCSASAVSFNTDW